MTTLWLWRALKHPPLSHPIYRRVITDIDDAYRWQHILESIFTHGQSWLWPLLFMIDMRGILFIPLGGTLFGLIWATTISSRIQSEQNKHTYELLCMTPDGRFGAIWAITLGCLHRERVFTFINSQGAWEIRLLLFVPFVASVSMVVNRFFDNNHHLTVLWIGALIAIYSLDHIQSIVLGCLWGIISAHLPANLDKRFTALVGFVGLQIITYLIVLLMYVIGFTVLQVLVDVFNWTPDIIFPLFAVIIFFITREYTIKIVWRLLSNHLSIRTPSIEIAEQLERWHKHYDDTHVMVGT